MNIVEIELSLLKPAPWNPNYMDPVERHVSGKA
jgi:hypothetical protein